MVDSGHGIHIVGGGLTGLTTALLLADRGLACHVHHAGSKSKDTGLTTTMNAVTYQRLQSLGVVAGENDGLAFTPITAIGVSDRGVGKCTSANALLENALIAWDSPPHDSSPLAYVVSNHGLLGRLSELVAASPLISRHSNSRITGFQATHPKFGEAAACLTIGDGQQPKYMAASLVIAADGSRSPLRQAAKIKTIRPPQNQAAITAIVTVAGLHANTAWQAFLVGGPLALMPYDIDGAAGNKMALVWTRPANDARRLNKLSDGDFIAEVKAASANAFGGISAVAKRASFPLQSCYVPRPFARRLLLVGDAAHTLHPLAGQGYNLNMGDGVAVADILAQATNDGLDIGSRGVLVRYGRRRLAETASMAVACEALNGVFSHGTRGMRQVAAIGMAVVAKTPFKHMAESFAGGRLLAPFNRLNRG